MVYISFSLKIWIEIEKLILLPMMINERLKCFMDDPINEVVIGTIYIIAGYVIFKKRDMK